MDTGLQWRINEQGKAIYTISIRFFTEMKELDFQISYLSKQ